jgi:ribosomal protein S19
MKLQLYSRDEYRRFYHYIMFAQLPYKDHFFFRTKFRLSTLFKNLKFFVFGGKLWFKFKVTDWNCGFSVRLFTWTKRVAIYKKKKK